jgi:hypothetical protein
LLTNFVNAHGSFSPFRATTDLAVPADVAPTKSEVTPNGMFAGMGEENIAIALKHLIEDNVGCPRTSHSF